jgi:type I restriction enzyme S subunit
VLLGLATIQRNGGFRTDSLQTYGGESPDKLLVQPGDLYLSLKDVTQSADLLGAVARLPHDHRPGRLTQDTVKLEPKSPGIPLDYLYWLLRTPQYRSYCRSHATGTTNLGLAREAFLAFPAPEPTPVQERIVQTLAALDDKIELNRLMNETLEAMARALFKSWFVDFAPVRAKMNLPSPPGRGVGGEGTKPALRAKAPIPTEFLEFARQLRHQATDAENLLWRLLRGRQIANAKFRRQHAFPPYILDFYCHELKLAVELDGGQHNVDAGQRRDARRDEYLAGHGIRVLRFWNNEVLRETEAVLEAIYAAVVEGSCGVPSPPAPLPAGEGSCGLPQPLADLFPDSFEDSELGEIPRGWGLARFADTIEIVGGGTPKTSIAEYWGGDIPWFSVADAPTDSEVWVLDTEKKLTRAGVENSSTRVLPVGTTIISARGTVGRVALVGVPMAMNQSCYGLRGLAGRQGFFNYYSTRELVARLQQHAHGSVFDTITRDTLAGVSAVVPPGELVERFEKRVGPSLERIRAGLLETHTLAALRDALLPKLISGELRVKDAERFVGRVV